MFGGGVSRDGGAGKRGVEVLENSMEAYILPPRENFG
jgi:hypothetical protein